MPYCKFQLLKGSSIVLKQLYDAKGTVELLGIHQRHMNALFKYRKAPFEYRKAPSRHKEAPKGSF